MFLDGQLRRIAEEKRRLVMRGELERRLLRLEWGLAGTAARRSWAGLFDGLDVAGRLLRWLRRA
ncbi:MAG: hypothetical protein AAGU21_05365 [Solidesulfovibrio sp.]|uniref:hypothetical protein n=1 Tax=Solidesulfovibrio sp. TaxID=2910990 RepID=UPI002B1ECFF4|nr:hypothetical protein [Solidesulfovibrio sp.]MEA4858264.1 hypothetical protein [Solidesulfovibrio sp.]